MNRLPPRALVRLSLMRGGSTAPSKALSAVATAIPLCRSLVPPSSSSAGALGPLLTSHRFCSVGSSSAAGGGVSGDEGVGVGEPKPQREYTPVELIELNKKAAEAFQGGDFIAAIDHWEVVATAESHNESSPTLMSCLNNLACAYGEVGDHRRKLKLLERSLQMVAKVYGTEHPQYGMVLYNMACAKEEMGRYEEMRQLLEASLALHERYFKPKHAKVGRVLLLLASAYDHVGEHARQLQTAQRAYEIVRRHCGPEHVQTTIAMMTLARAYGSNGQPEQYLQMALAALDIQEKKLGPANPQVALTLLELAGAYAANGEYHSQKETLERAVSVQKRAFGKQHTYLIDTYIALGEACDKLGDTATMAHHYNEALKVARSRYQGKHIGIGVAATKAAVGALRTGQRSRARVLAEEAQGILSVSVSAAHPASKELAAVMAELEVEEARKKAEEDKS